MDLNLFYVFDPPLGWGLSTPNGGQPLGTVPMDSVAQAPDTGYVQLIYAGHGETFQVGRTYVLRTSDGGHALIRPMVISWTVLTFAYKYQDDGSGMFTTTPVRRGTWGTIKLRYR